MHRITWILLIAAITATAQAAVVTLPMEYTHGDVVLEGFLAYDDSDDSPRPGVLIVHEWGGLGEHVKNSAQKLATAGYVGFALDMYGKGVYTEDPQEASKLAGAFRSGDDRTLMRERAAKGLEVLKGFKQCDPAHVAAIGYCFGGTTVLELARSGADLDGVVSFHGGLATPKTEDAKDIKARVLVLHGADDRHVKPEEVKTFVDEMTAADVDWQLVMYGNAVHSFTNPAAGDDPSTGVAYNEKAALRSWDAMLMFLHECFDTK